MATDSRASIRDRILQFKGKNLYLPPPLWMGSHLELFRCTFEPPQRDSGLGSALGTSDKHPGKEASGSTRPAASLSVPGHVERLSKTKNRTMKYKWIEKILEHEACGLKISRKSLKFFFRRKMIQQYESLVFLPVSCHDQSVIVAYVDFSTITEARRLVSKQRSFSTREWTDLQNTPVEPILLSILVSMIQAQRSPGLFFGSENTGHFQCCPRQLTASTPKLLFTKADDFEHIHLYQAKVPTEFLRQFDDTAFETSSSITVEHIEIPFAPFESFGARVVDTLRLQTPRERILEPSLEPSLDDRSAAIHPDCQSGGGRKRKLGNDDVESYDVRKKQGIILRSTRGNMSNCSASRDRQVA